MRYTARGRIVLGARRRAGGVELMLYDTGPGLPAAVERQLALPFRQDGQAGGHGLGLYIVQSLCQRCGYQLRIRAVAGRGSCVSVYLPHPAPR